MDIFLWLVYKPLFSIGFFFSKLEELIIKILDSSERGKEYADFMFWKEMSFFFPEMHEGSSNGALIHKALYALYKFFGRRAVPFEDASYGLLRKIEEKWDDLPKGKQKRKYDFELTYRESRDGSPWLTRREHREGYVYTEGEAFDEQPCVVFGNKQPRMFNPKVKPTRVKFVNKHSGMFNPKKYEWPNYDKNEEQ